MNIYRKLFNDSGIQKLDEEIDPIKKVGMALREYVPVDVTAFYLTFFSAAAGQPEPDKSLAQFTILPILGLIATFIVSIAKNIDSKSEEPKWWKKTHWGGVFVSTLAFVGWLYVSGGHFGTFVFKPFFIAMGFTFLGIVVPVVYGLLKKPS
ncbi:MAG: hypothetical protein J0L96_11205 [Anaerolineae bacterium]|nr:hypothetical protein [Anaerolineae bacterium]